MVHYTKEALSKYWSLLFSQKFFLFFKTNWFLEWISINPLPFYHKHLSSTQISGLGFECTEDILAQNQTCIHPLREIKASESTDILRKICPIHTPPSFLSTPSLPHHCDHLVQTSQSHFQFHFKGVPIDFAPILFLHQTFSKEYLSHYSLVAQIEITNACYLTNQRTQLLYRYNLLCNYMLGSATILKTLILLIYVSNLFIFILNFYFIMEYS